MKTILFKLLAVSLVLVLSGCSFLSQQEDDKTIGWSAQRIYSEARDEMNSGNWEKGAKLLETLEARYPFGRYAQQAQIEVAYAYHRAGDATSALAACDRFIKLHPNHPNLDYVYYLKGVINFNDDLGLLGRWIKRDLTDRDQRAAREAFESYKEVVTRFPESKYGKDSLLRMRYLVNALAMSEVHVARYYMQRGAYLAAANRAQVVLKTYQETPAVLEALHILVKAYDSMGMADLRDDAKKVLVANEGKFPKETRDAVGDENRRWYELWK